MSSSPALAEIEDLIRTGRKDVAREKVQNAIGSQLTRGQTTHLASLAWRCDLPITTLELLRPFVRPTPKAPQEATDEEKVEYAIALCRVGALVEAMKLAKEVDSAHCPKAHFVKAAIYVSTWDYDASIPELEQYLASPLTTSYDKVVAQVNLLAAFVFERKDSSFEALHPGLVGALSEDKDLLKRKVFELEAIHALDQKQFAKARDSIRAVSALTPLAGDLDRFFVNKWEALIQLAESPDSKSIASVQEIRQEAQRIRHWETVRQCDQYIAVHCHDKNLFIHLYFGSPHPGLRKRLVREFPETVSLPLSYGWKLGKGKGPTLCLADGKSNDRPVLKTGRVPHRLLATMVRDFYRPFTLAGLFERVYPEEHFDPSSSRLKLHQAKSSLRQSLALAKFPLRIEKEEGVYLLVPEGGCTLEVSDPSKGSLLMDRISGRFPNHTPFSLSELAGFLEISVSSARRILQHAQEQDQVERHGSGPKTQYRLRR